jgi:undecaprenyl-diphosphatase
MNLLEAIILGIVQGLTEFIPISSSGHLILTGKFMGLDGRLTPEQITAFIAVIQLGTLGAVIVYFLSDILSITIGFIKGNLALLKGQRDGRAQSDARLGWLIIIGSLPIATVGLALKDFIEGPWTKNLYVIGASMIIWALMLWVAEIVSTRKKVMEDLGVKEALVVGFAQVVALIPGSSRSGMTITGALFAGLTRDVAARFSFLLSIPAIAASGLLELKEALDHLESIRLDNLIVATLVSAIVGYASIAFLIYYLRRHSTYIFIVYRLLVGAVILALVFTHTISPN